MSIRRMPPWGWVLGSLLATTFLAALCLLWQWQPNLHLSEYGAVGSEDFIAYWSAARLVLQGGNPYDPSAQLAVQQAVGWSKPEAWHVWSPPWSLAPLLPLGLLPFGLATLAWIVIQSVLLMGSGVVLWHYFAPGDSRYWIGLVLAAAFAPALYSIGIGQMGGLLLAGVVGFLWAERRKSDLLAGGALALLMIKPQVTYLFWLAALWWAWQQHRRRVLVGWLAAMAATGCLVVLLGDSVLAGYGMVLATPPLEWATATLGAWLRILLGMQRSWLQFLPSLIAVLALLVWLWRRRGVWRWDRIGPPLLLASSLTTPYGGIVDQTVLLPVVVALVSQLRATSPIRRAAVLGALGACELALIVARFLHLQEVVRIRNVLPLDAAYWLGVPVLAAIYWWAESGPRLAADAA